MSFRCAVQVRCVSPVWFIQYKHDNLKQIHSSLPLVSVRTVNYATIKAGSGCRLTILAVTNIEPAIDEFDSQQEPDPLGSQGWQLSSNLLWILMRTGRGCDLQNDYFEYITELGKVVLYRSQRYFHIVEKITIPTLLNLKLTERDWYSLRKFQLIFLAPFAFDVENMFRRSFSTTNTDCLVG